VVPLPPHMSSGEDPVQRWVYAHAQRVQAFVATDDASVILSDDAEQEAVTLIDTVVRSVFSEQRLVTERHLAALAVVGWLFWSRAAATAGSGDFERNHLLAFALLAPVRDAAPASVPEAVRSSIPPASRPGDPQIGSWNNYVGILVTQAEPDDRTALIISIAVLQLALGMSDTSDERARCLNNLVYVLTLLHETRTDPQALAEAVRLARWLINEIPAGTAEHARGLGRLSDALRMSYESSRDDAVLAEAIDHARAGLAELPPNHPDRVDQMTNLAGLLRLRSSDLGNIESLREAVAISRALVADLPPDHPALARSLNNLASNLEALSSATGNGTDPALLDEIIDLSRAALDGATSRARLEATAAADLSRWLTGRAEETSSTDAAEAVFLLDKATSRVRLEAMAAANLSRWLTQRAERTNSRADAAEAVSLARRAVASVDGGRVPGVALRALSQSLSALYAISGDPAVLAEAVAVARQSVDESADAAELAARRMTLGVLLNNHYADTGDVEAAREAATVLRLVARSTSARLPDRVDSAAAAGKLAVNLEEWGHAANDLALAVSLLPDLAGSHLRAGDRERRLVDHAPLPTLAASCAIATGRPERALEILEQGRGVWLSEVAGVHDGARRLTGAAPHLATALDRVSVGLRTTQEADRLHELVVERRRLIDEIRGLPGFERFLEPPRIDEILRACQAGPVVVLVHARYRFDALIVTTDEVRHVPLPNLTWDVIKRLARDLLAGAEIALHRASPPERRSLGEYSIWSGLMLLWDAVVGPVLDELKLLTPPHDGVLPRVWWCPTGPLTFFPLHMAGHHEGPNAFDLAISSYTPTVHALGRTPPWRLGPDTGALVVALPHTPGAPDLPAADHEAALLARRFPKCRLMRGPAATREKVMAALPDHEIVHLACHAGHDADSTYESHLLLHDGRLHLSDIGLTRTDQAGLAFLSACGTARSRLDLPDESLNLVTGFHVAGFSQLVGSLWTIPDQATTAHMANHFYTELFTNQEASVAHALHHAVRQLRKREPDRPSLWAPYLHVGP
jgi:hypothetical protein